MAVEVSRSMGVSSIKRFPQHIREELNKLLQRSSWQSLTRVFSVDILTGLQPSALDDIADLVDDSYPEFKEDVKKRLTLLKKTTRGQAQSFRGKSKVGFHSEFYRFWLVGRHNDDGLYDVMFCHICRKEEFDLFLFLTKVMKGGAYMLTEAPQILKNMLARIPSHVLPFLESGNFQEDEVERPAASAGGNLYTDLSQDLGDRLTEYELVEDLIERGTLGENADGSLFIRLQ